MSKPITIDLDLVRFRLPPGVNARLQALLDKQDSGVRLSSAEREEAEGLVEVAETLSLLGLQVKRNNERRD